MIQEKSNSKTALEMSAILAKLLSCHYGTRLKREVETIRQDKESVPPIER